MLARIPAAVDVEPRITAKDYDSPVPHWMRRMPALLTMPALLGANEHRTKRACKPVWLRLLPAGVSDP